MVVVARGERGVAREDPGVPPPRRVTRGRARRGARGGVLGAICLVFRQRDAENMVAMVQIILKRVQPFLQQSLRALSEKKLVAAVANYDLGGENDWVRGWPDRGLRGRGLFGGRVAVVRPAHLSSGEAVGVRSGGVLYGV